MTDQKELDAALDRARNWYEQTANPLYVWEAMAWCLNAEEPKSIPDWCLPYLRVAATNLYRLYCGIDFREVTKPIEPNEAPKLVPEALAISRQGTNMFAKILKDRDDSRAALDEMYSGRGAHRLRTVTEKSANRRIARGKRLISVKPKTS